MTTTLSPTVHETMVARHKLRDVDDPILDQLTDAVKLTRELAHKAGSTTQAVLRNEMRTLPQRHREARTASFALLEKATAALDAAVKDAEAEIAAIAVKVKGPAPAKDPLTETKQRELRERLSQLPEDRRRTIISAAIKSDDQLLVAAVLSAPAWLSGLSDSDLEIHRFAWASKNFAPDINRLERLQKAADDATRAGSLAIAFVDSLTNAELIAQAEQMERQASEALAAAKAS